MFHAVHVEYVIIAWLLGFDLVGLVWYLFVGATSGKIPTTTPENIDARCAVTAYAAAIDVPYFEVAIFSLHVGACVML